VPEEFAVGLLGEVAPGGRVEGQLRFSGVRPSAAYQRKYTGYVEQV
jgi:hypothetical protein